MKLITNCLLNPTAHRLIPVSVGFQIPDTISFLGTRLTTGLVQVCGGRSKRVGGRGIWQGYRYKESEFSKQNVKRSESIGNAQFTQETV